MKLCGSVTGTGLGSLFVALLVATAAGGCVSASEGRRMQQDIEVLNARFEQLSESAEGDRERLGELLGAAASLEVALEQAQEVLRRSNIDMGTQLDAYQSELQSLRATTEQLEHEITRIQTDLEIIMATIYSAQ